MLFGNFNDPKPRRAYFQLPVDNSTIRLYQGGDEAADKEVFRLVNFMHEMFKFLPKFERMGYETGKEGDLTDPELGKGKGIYYDKEDRYFKNSLKINGKYQQRYGDWHHTSVDNNNDYWGYGGAESGKNLDFNPAAADSNFFDKLTPKGHNKPVDYQEYAKLIAWEAKDQGKFKEIKSSELTAARQYMKQIAGKRNFYEFVTEGMDKIVFNDKTGDGQFTLETDDTFNDSACPYLWKNISNKQAYYIMLNLLESRRRVFYASSKVFGPRQYLADSSKMINYLNNFYDGKLATADQRNFRIFGMYLKMQHSFRSPLLAMAADGHEGIVRGNGGGAGFIYSARDRVAMSTFSSLIRSKVTAYVKELEKNKQTADQHRVDMLLHEFSFHNNAYADKYAGGDYTYDINQPYSFSQWDSSHNYLPQLNKRIGWDSISGSFYTTCPSNLTQKEWEAQIPKWINPMIVNNSEFKGVHPHYASLQLYGLTDNQIKGYENLNFRGKSRSLYHSNWVVHLVGRYMRADDYAIQKTIETLGINEFENIRYSRETSDYKKKKEDFEDRKEDDRKEESRIEAAIGRARAHSAKKAQEYRQMIETDAKRAEAKKKFMMQLFVKMMQESRSLAKKDND